MTSKRPDADDILPRDHALRRLPGLVVSRVSGGIEKMKDEIGAVFRVAAYPRPRPLHAPFLPSPAALSVLDGPPMTRSEIERFKQELQNALVEVNQFVEPSARGLSRYDRSSEEVAHIMKLLEVHAADVKYAIDVGVSSGKVSQEGAQELKWLIDHLVLSMRDVRQWKLNFSISNLTALLGLPMRVGPLVNQVSSFVGFVQTVFLFQDIISPPKNGPGLFRDIGKRAKGVLYEGYASDATAGLGMVLNSESTDKLSMIAGFKVTDQNVISRSFVKLNDAKLSIDVNAVLNGNSVAKITLDDAWVPDTKCILSVPVPWRNPPKFEYECLGPYYGITASAGLDPHPVLDFSGLWGNRLMSAGFRFELKTATSTLSNYAAGLTVVRDHSAFGATINNHGLLTGTIWNDIVPKRSYVPDRLRRLVDPMLSYLIPDVITTQVGAMFDYCVASNRMRCMIGVNHEFDSDTTIKARIDTSGGATAMVKRKIGDKALVSVSTEVNLNDVWKLPRAGVCLSLNE